MDRKRQGIIVCVAALAVVLGILVYSGVRHVPKQDPAYAVENIKTVSSTGTAVSVSRSGVTADAGDGASGEQQTARPTEGSQDPSDGSRHASGGSHGGRRDKPVVSPAPKKSTGSSASPVPGRREDGKRDPKKTAVPKATPNATPAETGKTGEKTMAPAERQISLRIHCTKILEHRDLWKDGIEEIIPPEGIFYSGKCSYSEGDTVYDVLKRVCEERDIALDSQYTPIYGTYYIRSIGNLYEFDCGSESGWKYSVNGKIPSEGCSSYLLSNGDDVIIYYDYEV